MKKIILIIISIIMIVSEFLSGCSNYTDNQNYSVGINIDSYQTVNDSFYDAIRDRYFMVDQEYKFIKINITLTAVDQQTSTNPSHFKLFTSDGSIYDFYVMGLHTPEEIHKGTHTSFWILYQIPITTLPNKLVYFDSNSHICGEAIL